MSEATQAEPGMYIENRYRLVQKIAEGGMATVYQAQDERLGRPVAIKIMHTQLAQGVHREQFIARFRREATSAASIANPHIVQVYDTGEYEGLDYLVMEYVHGVNLRYEMNMHGTFTVKDTLRVLAETLDGLASAHLAGVVHRDIKPENILINDRGHVQITDFGLAKAISQATLSSTGLLLGTAAYLAPEMIENNIATPQGDLYSAGTMAWEMLAGRVPFTADNPVTLVFKHVHEDTPSISTVCNEINADVAKFLETLTSRDMNLRPSDASEALLQLKELVKKLNPQDFVYRLAPTELNESYDDVDSNKIANLADKINNKDDNSKAGDSNSNIDARNKADINSDINSDIKSDYNSDIKTAELKQNTDFINTDAVPNGKTDNSAETQAIPLSNTKSDNLAYGKTFKTSQNDPLEAFNDNNLPTISLQKAKILNESINSEEKQKEKSHKKKIIIISSSAAAAICVCVIGGLLYFYGPNSYWSLPKPNDLQCSRTKACKITNVQWKNYEKLLKASGIPYSMDLAYSDDIDSGYVISTTPDIVGGHVGKHNNDMLKVVVSRGIRQSTIPIDIMTMSKEEGTDPIEALRKAGFTDILHRASLDMYSLEVPQGKIIEITPDPGTTMDHNKPVTVVISRGPMPVEMPDIVNKPKTDIQQTLDDLKLKADYKEEYSDTVDKGNVISASKDKGAQLHWGDKISIVVSKGPKTITMPDVRGKNTNEARKILEGLGLKIRISAPLGDYTHVVRLQSAAPGKEVPLKDSNGNPTVITLTVV